MILNNNYYKKFHIDCECHSAEHQQLWAYDDEENEVWCGVYVKDWQSFFKRFVKAVKYLFRSETSHGHFDTFLLPHKDIPDFIKFLENAHKAQEKSYADLAEKIIVKQKKPNLPGFIPFKESDTK
mgnify:CR=1 FL=1